MKIINYDTEIINPNLFIPEEVLLEIFHYLPLKSMYKFTCVSKVWFSLLTKTLKPLSASYYTFYGHLAVASSDLLSSKFVYDDGFSFKFIYSRLHKVTRKLCLVGSSNGLILVATDKCDYYVFNPLTKRISGMIPNRKGKHERIKLGFLHGFICQSKCSSTTTSSTGSSSSSFMVARIQGFDNRYRLLPTKFEIQVFSSELGKWNAYAVPSPPGLTWGKFDMWDTHNGVCDYDRVCTGNILITNKRVLYWFEGERQSRIMAYDLKQCQCELMKLPDGRDEEDFNYQCLGELGESICYSQFQQKAMTLCIWINNQSSYTSEWELVHKIELQNMLARDSSILWFKKDYLHPGTEVCPLAFHPVDTQVILLADNTNRLALNVHTNRFNVLKRLTAEVIDAYGWLRSELPLVLTPRPTTIPRPLL